MPVWLLSMNSADVSLTKEKPYHMNLTESQRCEIPGSSRRVYLT